MAVVFFSLQSQRGAYANEAQKQTLLQGKCVTYNKNKLNNKGNR
jgi:hypothetical protein